TKSSEQYESWQPLNLAPLFLDKLKWLGYDVIYLDFHNGADFMEHNAMLLLELIKRVNFKKCGSEEIAIIGASMGGQVARFALSYMEQNHISHCVRTTILFDSPNEGANIPIGLQHFIKYFNGKLPSIKDLYYRKLKRAATQELL